MDHHKTKKLWESKGNNQSNEEKAHRVRDIFSSYVFDRELMSGIYKELNKERFKNSKTQ